MKRRPTTQSLLLGGLLLLTPFAARADAPTAHAVPAVQQQAFRLGYALGIPAAQTETFLQAVKALKEINDDAQSVTEIDKLAKQSENLRAGEQRAYRQTTEMLHKMDAPADLQAWAGGAAYRLGLPLVLSKEAEAIRDKDPDTATVMGTIDEAQEIATDSDGHQPSLIAWLKLKDGAPAVWATGLGTFAAGMHTAVMAGRGLYLSRAEPMRLRDLAPIGTPSPVLDVLTALSPSTGNLAGLVQIPSTLIPPKDLRDPQKTLLDSYGARVLAAMIDKGP